MDAARVGSRPRVRAGDRSLRFAGGASGGVFLGCYGHEFDEPARQRILARLRAEAEREVSSMSTEPADAPHGPARRRVPVKWDELEMALTWRMDDVEPFLDLRTGEVRHCRLDRFGQEPEEGELSEEEADTGLAEGYLIRVEPFPSSREWGWMAEFAASVSDLRLRERLEAALRGRGAFRRFKDVLAVHPRERERWFAFHHARVREAMVEWLEDNDIEPTTEPPERPAR